MTIAIVVILMLVLMILIVFLLIIQPIKADGTIVVKREDGKKTFSLEFDDDPDDLDQKQYVLLKVFEAQE